MNKVIEKVNDTFRENRGYYVIVLVLFCVVEFVWPSDIIHPPFLFVFKKYFFSYIKLLFTIWFFLCNVGIKFWFFERININFRNGDGSFLKWGRFFFQKRTVPK